METFSQLLNQYVQRSGISDAMPDIYRLTVTENNGAMIQRMWL